MNKTNAKKIAETITFAQLQEMFNNARKNVNDWTEVSVVNKQMTKGTAWNILYPSLKPGIMIHAMAVKNMIWEFGDYLPDHLKIKKQSKNVVAVNITHQEPIFKTEEDHNVI